MKKDIEIPEVEGVSIAAILEYNQAFKSKEWNAYIINEQEEDMEMILIVSKGYDEERNTSVIRHKLEKLPKQSYAKIEYLQDDVLSLNNEFYVTFFMNNKMYEKKFVFKKNTINEKAYQPIPLIDVRGVLVK